MVARRRPEGWTEINEFDWSGRKLAGQLNNLVAVQVDKAICNLAVYEKQCDYRIAVLEAKIRQVNSSNTSSSNTGNNKREEVPLKNN